MRVKTTSVVINKVEDISEVVEYYKPLLGISDWAVRIELKRQIDVGAVAGRSWSVLSRRLATIQIIDHDTRCEDDNPDDDEMTIVHELLHIAFKIGQDMWEAAEGTKTEFDLAFEQPIDQLSETLVTLRRMSGHKFSFEGRF